MGFHSTILLPPLELEVIICTSQDLHGNGLGTISIINLWYMPRLCFTLSTGVENCTAFYYFKCNYQPWFPTKWQMKADQLRRFFQWWEQHIDKKRCEQSCSIGSFYWQRFISHSLCPLLKENKMPQFLEWRPGSTILFLTNEGKPAPGCLAATCFSSIGTLILIMDSLEQLDSTAPTQPTALRKEAEVFKGGMVCLITRQKASRIFRCSEFYVQSILYFQSFDP